MLEDRYTKGHRFYSNLDWWMLSLTHTHTQFYRKNEHIGKLWKHELCARHVGGSFLVGKEKESGSKFELHELCAPRDSLENFLLELKASPLNELIREDRLSKKLTLIIEWHPLGIRKRASECYSRFYVQIIFSEPKRDDASVWFWFGFILPRTLLSPNRRS